MFKRFYDTVIEVYDDLGDMKYSSEKKCVYIGSIMADIQPFRIGTIESLIKKQYGFDADSMKKLFCKKNDILKQGYLLCAEGKKYRCVYVEERRLGMTAILREVRE